MPDKPSITLIHGRGNIRLNNERVILSSADDGVVLEWKDGAWREPKWEPVVTPARNLHLDAEGRIIRS